VSLRIGVACFSTFGGSGVVAAEIARALARRGHSVHVFSDAPPSRLDGDAGGVALHVVEAPAYPQLGHDLYTLALASSIIGVARTDGLDVVHAHYALPHAVSAELARQVLAADGPAPRVVTTLHGTDTTLVGIDPTFRPLTRHAVLASDAVTVPSAWLAATTRENLDLPAAFPIDVVPNFVDADRFTPAAAPAPAVPTLVHVSNFRALKRAGDVVRIFARVRAALPARLRLVGDGPDHAATLALAAELGVAADVEVLGERDDDLPRALAGAAAFLLPSETESFGLAALEALASGVPVVASRVGGVPEVVLDGATGFLHAVGDVEAMAASALRLCADVDLRARLGGAARARALASFRVAPAVDRYEAIYGRVLAT
jgi:N-acetyl-alpha-D-glucosaminyl L-malate synthase BshA